MCVVADWTYYHIDNILHVQVRIDLYAEGRAHVSRPEWSHHIDFLLMEILKFVLCCYQFVEHYCGTVS